MGWGDVAAPSPTTAILEQRIDRARTHLRKAGEVLRDKGDEDDMQPDTVRELVRWALDALDGKPA